MSFTLKIIVGLLLGIFTGLFLGELAAPLTVVGNAFIGLLQMTVLPYISVALIANIGGISWAERSGLLKAGILVLALSLLLGMLVLLVVPLAFPDWVAASFFSTTLIADPKAFDFVALYIPSNPFGALANNVVPAVVLFSILLGVGVSAISQKESLLRVLHVAADGLTVVNKLIIKLTPYGVFAIAGGVAGTIWLEDVEKLQTYLITYSMITLVMAFIVLPLLVSAMTPFSYRDLLSVPRDTLLTVFAVGTIIVVLPRLVEHVRELYRRHGLDSEDVDTGATILMPLAYPFPNLGTYLILMFLPFAAWYLGNDMDMADHLMFHASGLLSSFVAPIIGVPFLLDMLQIPADMLELFVVSNVYTDRIRVVLGGMHLLCMVVVAVAISTGTFRLRKRRLLMALAVSSVVLLGSLVAIRAYLSVALQDTYHGDRDLIEMVWMDRPVPSRQWDNELPPAEPGIFSEGRLAAIERRGTVRVAYLPDSLPFAFRNRMGQVTGFDAEMANYLALDLGVELELVRTRYEDINRLFESGQIDIVMSGLGMTSTRVRKWAFGEPMMDLTLGLLVPDYQRKQFSNVDQLVAMKGVRLGVVQNDQAFKRRMASFLPLAEIVDVDSPREFMRGNRTDLDAVIYSAEGGSAWTLVYPDYSVVVPQGANVRVPMGYPLPRGDPEWHEFVSAWVGLQKKNGTFDRLFNHWIRGGGAQHKEPRWSIIRDVLGWVE